MSAPSDMNDLARIKGKDAVRLVIDNAKPPSEISGGQEQPSDKNQPSYDGEPPNDPLGGSGTFGPDGKRVIRHDSGHLPEILDQLGAAFAEADDLNLFVHANRLVRISHESGRPRGSVHRPQGALVLIDVSVAHGCELAGRSATHEKFDNRNGKYRRIDCPVRVIEAYLARRNWVELRKLTGFVQAPIVTLDGQLIDRAGFDANTGLYLAVGEIDGYKRPSKQVGKAAAERAINRLRKSVELFPFVSEADVSATLAGILTALLRRLLPAAPMMAITAPSPGTGKTLLAETFSLVATGLRASVLSLGHDETEAEKRLGGVLLAGDAAILLDNIERPLSGDLLCQVLTQPSVRLRPLGASGMVSVPTTALIIATGNNLAVLGDLKRRVVLIRLDAGEERPEQRKFSRDHLEDIFANRGELITAALSIPLAYQSAGSPAINGLYPLGGFEQWDAMVRRPLVWLGLPDPLQASEGLREQDPDLDAMRQLFSAWQSIFGEVGKTTADVITAGLEVSFAPGGGDPSHPELRDALQVVCSEKPNSRRLGYWLRAHRDRIIDGMQLTQVGRDAHSKIAKWMIRKCG